MRARRAAGVAAALLLVPLTTSACGTAVAGPSLVLRLASPDKATDDTAPPIEYFAAQVARRSEGTIRIEPVWDVAPAGTRDWDQVTAGTVVDGTYELGLVPSRGFDRLGVDSLRALNAPFLVTSQAAEKAVLDSDLRDDLMSGLPDAGLVGLDLFPDGLRHPFGYDRPLLGPGDYDGTFVRAGTSDTVGRLFAALGAHVDDLDPAVLEGGAEAQYSIPPVGTKVATGNVTFFAKVNVLVAGQDVADRVRADQWDLLQEAAAATRGWQSAHLPTDREAATTYCRHLGVIVSASADEVAGLEARAAPVTDWLDRDPETRRLVDGITTLVHATTAEEPVTSCPRRTAGDAAGQGSSALNGTYVTHITRRDLLDAGVTDESLLQENSGRLTFTLEDGRWGYSTQANHFVANPVDSGRFDLQGDTFTYYWDESPGDWTRMHVRVAANGSLHFTEILDGQPVNQSLSEGWFGVPWTRVGDLPD